MMCSLARLMVLLALACTSLFAFAQSAPWKPTGVIKLVVPFTAGGATDRLARVVAGEMSKTLGTTIVENKPGAGGNIGNDYVAKSAPDGHTICVCSAAILSMAGVLGEPVNFDPEKDFVALTGGWGSTLILVVRNDLPIHNISELIAYARANPGKLNYGLVGFGGPPHMGGEMLKYMAKVNWTNIPYPGESDAIRALVGGFLDFYAPTLVSAAIPLVKEGKLRAIATFSSKRSDAFPNLPTIIEQGYPEFNADVNNGFLVPAKTPARIIDVLSQHMQMALRSPIAVQAIDGAGMVPLVSDPQTFEAILKRERLKWTSFVKLANIKGQ